MPQEVSESSREVLSLSDPDRTVALSLMRWSDSPEDPVQIAVDHALLDQLAWRPGDRITFEPVALDRGTREGGLIIRRATRREPAIKLRREHYRRRINPYAQYSAPGGPDGPEVEWPFPREWVDTFLPQENLLGPGPPMFIPPGVSWMLRELLDRRERVAVPLGCSLLEFRLQRSNPAAPTLDVHLPLGVLHLMGWSPAPPLALTSRTGFDPSAREDVLTIRQVSPGESNLAWDGGKFVATPGPVWLERYFPGVHDNTEGLPPGGPVETGSDDPDLIRFPGEDPFDEDYSFADRGRDTFGVHYGNFRLTPGSLSFAIPESTCYWW